MDQSLFFSLSLSPGSWCSVASFFSSFFLVTIVHFYSLFEMKKSRESKRSTHPCQKNSRETLHQCSIDISRETFFEKENYKKKRKRIFFFQDPHQGSWVRQLRPLTRPIECAALANTHIEGGQSRGCLCWYVRIAGDDGGERNETPGNLTAIDFEEKIGLRSVLHPSFVRSQWIERANAIMVPPPPPTQNRREIEREGE